MAKYYYDVYKYEREYSLEWKNPYIYEDNKYMGYPDYVFYSNYGSTYTRGEYCTYDNTKKGYLYTKSEFVLIRRSWNWVGHTVIREEAEITRIYGKRGDYIKTVKAENGRYPDNGTKGDYWYVRRGLVFPELKMKVNGTLKISQNGWVKVDGKLREIDKIWTKINGVLREV